jgi:protein AFG1
MNLFVDAMEESNTVPNRKIRRVHFHEFMLDIHDRIHRSKLRNPRHDPLPPLALSIAQESRLLCLDEFQVTDIADAAILKRLLEMLWSSHVGMVLVTTSNRAPDALYEGGLNRSMFLPFIETLKSHMDVLEMSGRRDYRREKTSGIVDEGLSSFYWPADDPSTRQALDRIFAKGGTDDDGDQQGINYQLPVRMGRYVHVPRSNNHCAWFEFDDLCNRPLGAADYLSICERYEILIVDHVPQLDGSRFNEARRFVTLIDAVYESKTRLVLASNQVPLNELFVDFDATVESSDGDEEIAVDDGSIVFAPIQKTQEIFVKGEGGSSSSASTTMIRSGDGGTVEWSATGRIGVSLAQLSAVKDVSFSFQRAESRLAEINSGTWGR